MGILPMLCGIPTGGTPVRLMGKMPMLRFVRVLKNNRTYKSHQTYRSYIFLWNYPGNIWYVMGVCRPVMAW
jgi:hypothetical protein